MEWKLLFLPVVSALIGWFTNVLAVRMMFRPRKPWKVPLLPLSVQGLLPKRQREIARTIGETIERELYSMETLLSQLDIKSYQSDVVASVVKHVESRLSQILPGFLPQNIRAVIVQMVQDLVRRESDLLMDGVIDRISDKIQNEVSLASIAEQKILELDFAELEEIVLRVASMELKHIEVLGAVLGFIIGLAQLGILYLIQ